MRDSIRSQRVRTGAVIAKRQLVTVSGDTVTVPDGEQLVHLQLRRFAGCPVCNLHLQSLVRRYDELLAAGIREVVVFHSTGEELAAHQVDLPVAVVADPAKRLYREFGVESSSRAVLNPRAWMPILRGLLHSLRAILRSERPIPAVHPTGGRLGLPADFLIASDGRVLACRYGTHAYDQWAVDEILALVFSGHES